MTSGEYIGALIARRNGHSGEMAAIGRSKHPILNLHKYLPCSPSFPDNIFSAATLAIGCDYLGAAEGLPVFLCFASIANS